MSLAILQIQFGTGIAETVGKAAVAAGTVVLMLMVVALLGFAYKSLRGDGIEWPNDVDGPEASDDEVAPGDEDDEWEYY